MKKYTRALAGRRAQNNGAVFETLFQGACLRRGIATTRIPDGCKQLATRRIIRVRTPFDWALSYNGKAALIDTKTLDEAAFPNGAVDPNQAHTLLTHLLKGTIAGYVVNLRKTDTCMYIPASNLCNALKGRGSIKVNDPGVVLLGTLQTMDMTRLFTSV